MSGPVEPVVVFDVGNVLLNWDPRLLYRKIFASEAEVDWFLAHVCTMDWNLMQDGGRNWATGVAALSGLYPEWASQIAAYDLRWAEMVSGPVAPSVSVLEALKASGRSVYAITNFSSEKWAESQMRYPFLTLFDGVIVSGHEKLLKPDPAIYGLLFERYGLVQISAFSLMILQRTLPPRLHWACKRFIFCPTRICGPSLQRLG